MAIKNLVRSTLKLALSGAVVAAIAALFLILSDDGTVTEAQADLADIMPGGPDSHFRFERVIRRSGLEARPFDHNGNVVKFAVGESELSPKELMNHFQREFKREGINSQIYTDSLVILPDTAQEIEAHHLSEETVKRNEAMLRGEVVPIFVSDDIVSMASFVPKVKANDTEEIEEKWNRARGDVISLDDNMAGFRSIEARREPDTGRSTVTATWSDRGFDAHKANGNTRVAGASPDLNVPVCPGCKRLNRLEGLDEQDPYILNQIVSQGSVANIEQFYKAALLQRGWVPSDTQKALDGLSEHVPELRALWQQGGFLNFTHPDGDTMNVFISSYPGENTSIVTVQSSQQY